MFDGQARLAATGKVAVAKDGKPVADLAAPHVILATGARARSLPGLEPDGKLVWTYKEAMVPEAIPKGSAWYLPWRYGHWTGKHIHPDHRLDV